MDREKFEVANQLKPGFGYWIHTSDERKMKPEGNFSEGEFETQEGWNLIGINGHEPRIKSEMVAPNPTVWGWDGESQQFFDIDDESRPSSERGLLFPGQGYWVYKK